MEEKLKEIVQEILEVCTKANLIENPENLIHVLIAYFYCPEIKTDLDYAINAVIANIIHDLTGNIKEDQIKITTSELQRLCKCIMLKDEKEEPAWSHDNSPSTEEEEKKEVIEV